MILITFVRLLLIALNLWKW